MSVFVVRGILERDHCSQCCIVWQISIVPFQRRKQGEIKSFANIPLEIASNALLVCPIAKYFSNKLFAYLSCDGNVELKNFHEHDYIYSYLMQVFFFLVECSQSLDLY